MDTKPQPQQQTRWSKPELRRIGTLRDIALGKIAGNQAANGKFS